MAGAVKPQPVAAASLVGAPVEKLLKQLMLQKFESRACFTHGREIGGNFLRAVAGKNLRQLAVASFESGQRSQGGTAKVLERIVCHECISSKRRKVQSGRAGLQWRYIEENDSLGIATAVGLYRQ